MNKIFFKKINYGLKPLAILLAILTIATMFAIPTSAAKLVYTVSNNQATITDITEYNGFLQGDIYLQPYVDGYTITKIGDNAFADCDRLTSITIPSSVTSIGEGAFSGCSSLQSIEIPNSVTSIGDGAFWGCSSLTSISINSNNLYFTLDNGVLFNKDKSKLIFYPPSKTNTSYSIPTTVNTISKYAFSGARFSNVVIPNSITTISDHAFAGSDLTTVSIPNSVTSIGDSAFAGSSISPTIKLPNSITSIGDMAFASCENLIYIDIPEGVINIDNGAFRQCENLLTVYISNSVKRIGNQVFWYCENLQIISMGVGLESVDNNAFYGCWNIKEVSIRDIDAWCGIKFGYNANPATLADKTYYNGEILTDVRLTNKVTSICEETLIIFSIRSIAIPKSVTSIGANAITGDLETVYYCGTEEEWNNIEIDSSNEKLINLNKNYNYHFGEWEIITNPTCDQNGEKEKVCMLCGEEERAEISASHAYIPQTINPTCSEQGFTTYTCSVCGYNYNADYRSPYGHQKNVYNSINSRVYPFDLNNGIYSSTNKSSNSSSTFTISVIVDCEFEIQYKTSSELSYDKLIIEQNGKILGTFSGIMDSWQTIIVDSKKGDKLELTYKKDSSVSKGEDTVYFKFTSSMMSADLFEPKCIENVICDVCGEIVKSAKGHSYSEWFTNISPTRILDGEKSRSCSCCANKETQIIPAIGPEPDACSLVELKKAVLFNSDDKLLDYNGDNRINVLDLICLKRYSLNKGIVL